MSIFEFQELMRQLYYSRDARRGIEATFDWFVDEIRELGDALKNSNPQEISDEFADVMAWLASLANIANVDLEKAAAQKYSGKCPKCAHLPCKCPFRIDSKDASVQVR